MKVKLNQYTPSTYLQYRNFENEARMESRTGTGLSISQVWQKEERERERVTPTKRLMILTCEVKRIQNGGFLGLKKIKIHKYLH